jgi:uncharacterized surface protein with fasciclin (FAS1) repeats
MSIYNVTIVTIRNTRGHTIQFLINQKLATQTIKLNHMKIQVIISFLAVITLAACGGETVNTPVTTDSAASAVPKAGQSAVVDDDSQKDVVKVAVGSPDHTTLVAALKAAEYVDVLSNAGPFTVFAPTDEAFKKLPPGTVEDLVKPENKDKLRTILEYHVYVGGMKTEMMRDGQTIGQASGHNATIKVENGKYMINGANIVASVPASNGIIHVVDAVLLPPQ